jgi:hypothetical protein
LENLKVWKTIILGAISNTAFTITFDSCKTPKVN